MRITRRSRLPHVALTVGDALRRHGVTAVLTGGACASLYTSGAHQSVDVDFVLSGRVAQNQLDEAMASVGFTRRGDRYVHRDARYYVEFPRGPLALGGDFRVRPVRYRSGRAEALVLSPTDACRDRLAAFYHWSDRQSLRVAVRIALRNRISIARIRRWSSEEGHTDRYEEFVRELRTARRSLRKSG